MISPPASVVGALEFVGWFFQPDDLLGWVMVPGRQAWYTKSGFRSWVRVNRFGFRGADYDPVKPRGVKRVLVLGDSFGTAAEVAEDQTFSAVLEQMLNISGRYQVINAGVGGYSTEQEWLLLSERLGHFEPDVVLLAFHFGDDVVENSRPLRQLLHWRLVKLPRPYFELSAAGDLRLVNYPPPPEQVRRDWLYYYDLVRWRERQRLGLPTPFGGRISWTIRRLIIILSNRRRKARVRRVLPPHLLLFAQPLPELYEAAWQQTALIIERMQKQVNALGARFMVAGLCTKEQVLPGYLEKQVQPFETPARRYDPHAPNQRLQDISRDLRIPYLDLTPAFVAAQQMPPALFYDCDLHWNAYGHALAGQQMVTLVG